MPGRFTEVQWTEAVIGDHGSGLGVEHGDLERAAVELERHHQIGDLDRYLAEGDQRKQPGFGRIYEFA